MDNTKLYHDGILKPEADDFDIRCELDWTKDNPKLIFIFSPDIHPKNITELSKVLEKTTMKWLNCQSCSTVESCEKKVN